MIIEILDDNSIVKWKYKDTDDWKSAEISDLIKAYEERRPKGEWKNCGVSAEGVPILGCSVCGRQIATFRLPDKYPFCNCGADMRGEE